jgi:transposase
VADVPDLATAQALIATQQEELVRLQHENALLRHRIDLLCRRLFGQKSEHVSADQLRFAFAQLDLAVPPAAEPTELDSGESASPPRRRSRPTGRRPLPANLPRRRVVIDVPDAEKICPQGYPKTCFGEEVSEKLDYRPALVEVVETVRLKYACACHDGVTTAPAPPQAVEKSLATEGLLAHVVVSKFVDHLPLYRLERSFVRLGLDLSRTTLCGWVADVADALQPIGDELRRQVLATSYLQTDDTTMTILHEPGGPQKGRVWTYLDPIGRQVVFDATRTHEGEGPAAFLATFRGDLQADAYVGYDALYATGRLREIGCWAHTRRGFVEALPTDARAAPMIALIQQLYQLERVIAERTPDERRTVRQAQARPVLDQIWTEREQLVATVLPKSPLGEAVRYLTNQWGALQRYVEDGRLAIDNNRAENQLRVIALGRKNWLFSGSFAAARRTALLYSLVQSCALADVSPFDYLKDVLLRVATHPQRLIGQLTPQGWKQTFGPSAMAA